MSAPVAQGIAAMNPGTGPDIVMGYGDCPDCDGTGEIDCGRDWQRMGCESCNGTSFAPVQSREDYLADQADDAAEQDHFDSLETA